MSFTTIKAFKAAIFFFGIIVFAFLCRLIFLQIIVSAEYTANATEIRTINFPTSAHRGTIYDRNGTVLAVSVDSMSIYCNPVEVTNADYEARKLAEVLDGEKDEYKALLESDNRTFVYIVRKIDVVKAEQVKKFQLDGIYFIEESRREYPYGSIGGQIIGAVDIDGNGICGLEKQYDQILRGKDGIYSAERGEHGTPIPGGVHLDQAAVDGEDIMISLDIKMQDAAEKALEEGLKNNKPKKGSAVVMDSETGDIYAMCSYPYLNPADLKNSYIGSDRVTPIVQSFEPGSVFKAFSTLSVLQEGALSPDDVLFVPSEIQADEYTITDAHERPDREMSFNEILNVSSNVGISVALDKINAEKLYQNLKSLKFSEPTGVDFPGEDPGTMLDIKKWPKVVYYNIGFGQGMTATPLQIVRAYGAIANNGEITKPHFLIAKTQTNEWIEYGTERVLTDVDSIKTLREMLRGVVTSGTGKMADIPGYEVVGKTSTAQIAEDGGYAEDRWNLCFTGFIANSSSPLVCFVGANDVKYEGNMSPVFREIMLSAIDLYRIVPE